MADTPYKHGEFCWYEIATRDPATAKRFYSELLGYTIVDVPMPGGMEGTYTMVQLNGEDVAGLFDMSGWMPAEVPPHWMAYVWVDDVDAAAEKVRSMGGTVVSEPMDIPGVGRSAAVLDPTGAAISLFHGSEHPGTARLPLTTQGAIGWNELTTPDTAAARWFYTQLFGWTTAEQDNGEFVYTTFQRSEQGMAGMMPMLPEWGESPAHWSQYLTVDSCDATVERAKALGAEVFVPPQDVPDVGRFALLKDPTGAFFSVMQWTMGL